MNALNRLIDSITMYRLLIWGLGGPALVAVLFGFAGMLSYSGLQLLLSLGVLVAAALFAHYAWAKFYAAPANIESTLITALILFFIMSPPFSSRDAAWLALAAVIAVAAKYVIATRNRHLFNPAAFAAVALGFTAGGGAIWWIGSAVMLPATALVGLLIVKKIRRFSLVLAGITASVVGVLALGILAESDIYDLLGQHFLSWPIVFFAAIMMTEPQTMPPTRRLQLAYGAGVGLLSSIPFAFGPISSSPELALVIGNLFSYAVGLKRRLTLVLAEKIETARDTFEFVFKPDAPLAFRPGQYLEWTLPHARSDVRGIRRYFTIAASPTESDLRIGVRFGPKPSTFKQKLVSLEPGDRIWAGQLAGDFTLPAAAREKLAFVAGGIGITPFRSMIKYCMDRAERRDIVLFYSNRTPADIAYRDFLGAAERAIGLRTVYLVNEGGEGIAWIRERGFLTPAMIRTHVSDWKERTFYLSGPNAMVESYKRLLRGMGVAAGRIATDYFPGY
ncbi:oxidoreductase [Candidatus Parcubacteria bacterium]|nr:MAG: oxidoreductase [Candidatus Parcubacteria bacterium]